ncbi:MULTISPECIES: chaplin family protein [unclassified Streptomyces]|uniref:Chaplin family protein n=1 Tax=Streptomyces sp. NBC_00119 TaxID=2975659 RepID=A0AAU1U8Y5_9ACTN|nr:MULTISPECIES: chaplin family protein [unclassified Streptomyces]MCX4644143.1 chaplin family protein [Streptomyces sp. NBC_01446]MCX5325255.1 chaplin family protein [Streptomyces sp. NBC_00120]
MNTAKKAALVIAAAGLAAGAASGSAFAHGGAGAEGAAAGSPGVGSGNVAQVPVDVPDNVVGNTVNGIAGLNPAFGNSGHNG